MLSTGDQIDIGGYPHSGQGNPSGIKSGDLQSMLQKQRANTKGLNGIRARKPADTLDTYLYNALDGGTPRTEPGQGFGGLHGLMRY